MKFLGSLIVVFLGSSLVFANSAKAGGVLCKVDESLNGLHRQQQIGGILPADGSNTRFSTNNLLAPGLEVSVSACGSCTTRSGSKSPRINTTISNKNTFEISNSSVKGDNCITDLTIPVGPYAVVVSCEIK